MVKSDGLAALIAAQRMVSAGGTRFHIAEAGRGRTVMLLSGWPQTMRAWRHLFQPLSERYRVIAVEPPALGKSEPLAAGSDSTTVAKSILELATTLGVETFDLVGHDIGAWLAFPMGHLAAERVGRMVVVDAAIPGLAPLAAYALEPERLMKVWHFYFNALPDLPAALTAGRERIYMEQIFKTRSADFAATFTAADVDHYVATYERPGAMDAGFAYYRAIFKNQADNRELAKIKLTMPILAVGGASWLGPVMKASFDPVGTNVTGLSIEGSAHFVPEEQPDAFRAAVEAFLAQGV